MEGQGTITCIHIDYYNEDGKYHTSIPEYNLFDKKTNENQ